MNASVSIYLYGKLFLNSVEIPLKGGRLHAPAFYRDVADRIIRKKIKGKITFLISINDSHKKEISYFSHSIIDDSNICYVEELLSFEIERISSS
ncbi:MAG: hypothetical protein PHE21_03940 [Candidatus Dojkabacteria bacterium]|nr:hypothetical protein [Candidatus Dojkabacteria bacterium]